MAEKWMDDISLKTLVMQGSTMRLLDHSGQTFVSYGYDEFGADLFGNQGQFQPFGYTGYQRDNIAGTYYAQAREYDAWSGRFTNEDVIKGHVAYPETLNAYGYCWGNPLKYVDRDGEFPEWVNDCADYVKEWCEENVGIDYTNSTEMPMQSGYHTQSDTYHQGGEKIVFQAKNGKINDVTYNKKVNVGSVTVKGSVGAGNVALNFTGKNVNSNKEYNVKIKVNFLNSAVNVEVGSKKEKTNKGGGFRIDCNPFSNWEIYEYASVVEEGVNHREEDGVRISSAVMDAAIVVVVGLILSCIPGTQAVGVPVTGVGMIALLTLLAVDVGTINYDSANQCIS